MPRMTFYRQARVDGGIRTGLEWEDLRAFETFQEGPPEAADDPLGAGLLWYVDLRCKGEGIPDSPEKGRDWLIEHQDIVTEGFSRLADSIQAGLDRMETPILWSDFRNLPDGVSMTVAMSSMRRVDALELVNVIRDLSQHWLDYLKQLEPFVSPHW